LLDTLLKLNETLAIGLSLDLIGVNSCRRKWINWSNLFLQKASWHFP